uniref:Ig-like domain-containing protein n=1 Tax=Astyanax mexicanus TaxID=7994 RepID=A0A3B1ISR3_ASTMX
MIISFIVAAKPLSWQFFLTTVTPVISIPEFTAVGQVDAEQAEYYDSNNRTVVLKVSWLNKSDDEEHWEMKLHHAANQEAFSKSIMAVALKKDSSSPVVCHATGFFPKSVMISWQKNGEDLNEDVELRETLPNQDGTFQKRSILTVSPEELKNNNYTCVIQHSSLEKALVLLVSDHKVLSVGLIVGVMVGALLLVIIICAAVFIWKRRSSGE